MNLRARNVFLVVFLLCIITTANAEEVSKEDWMNAMSTALPTAFCQSHQYFRQCFEVTQVECEKTALSATRICLEKYKDKIPSVLNQPDDGTYWGQIIGKCVGEAYEVAFIKQRISSDLCNNIDNWR